MINSKMRGFPLNFATTVNFHKSAFGADRKRSVQGSTAELKNYRHILATLILFAAAIVLGASQTSAANTGAPHFAPKLLDFPNEVVGILASATSPPVSVKFINPRNGAAVKIKAVSIFGTDPADFAVGGTTCSGTLINGSVCRITVTFTPTLLGVREGTLTVKSDLGSFSIPLTGRGVPGVLKLTPAALSFGKQTDGVTSPIGKTVSITNGNPVALQVTQAQTTGSFQIQTNNCVGVLNAGQTCTIVLTVTPLCPVPEAGALIVSNDGASDQQSVALSVIGVANGGAPGPHVLIAGGLSTKGRTLASAELFDSVACKFKSTGSMSVPRVGHTATWLDPAIVPALGGQVLITGGKTNNSGAVTTSADLYDPLTGKFTPTGALEDPRANHSATLITEGPLAGMVLITGGVTTGGVPDSTAELFNPATGTFSFTTGTLNTGRSHHTALLMAGCGIGCNEEGDVLVAGGLDSSGNALDNAEVFDQASESFSCVGGVVTATGLCKRSLSSPRWKHIAVAGLNGRVTLIGGDDESGFVNPGSALQSTDVYAPASQVLAEGPTMIDARQAESFASLTVGSLSGLTLVMGGLDASGATLSSAELLDPAHNSFACIGGRNPLGTNCTPIMASPRAFSSAVAFASGPLAGSALITGGIDAAKSATLRSAELFNSTTAGFFALPNMTVPRSQHRAILLP